MSETLQVSKLEEVFGFRDATFRQYMGHKTLDSVTPRRLANEANMMATHDHPLVMHAAGWAAAELALYKPPRDPDYSGHVPSQADRHQALSLAEILWKNADESFGKLVNMHRSSNETLAAELWALQVRARLAAAYMPSLRMASELRGGRWVDHTIGFGRLRQSHQQVLKVGKRLVYNAPNGKDIQRHRSGLAYEIMGGLLLQAMDSPEHIIVPAPVRKDHNRMARKRADLMAVSVCPPHVSTFVQVSGHEGARRGNPFYCRLQRDDLLIDPKSNSTGSLGAYIDQQVTQETNSDVGLRLATMSSMLVGRLIQVSALGRPVSKVA